jgi:hypothetical protein
MDMPGERLVAPVKKGLHLAKVLGEAALEVFDQPRLVRRLEHEHEWPKVEQMLRTYELAKDTGNHDVALMMGQYIVKRVANGLLSSHQRYEAGYEDRVLLVKTLLHEQGDNRNLGGIGLTPDEQALLERLI